MSPEQKHALKTARDRVTKAERALVRVLHSVIVPGSVLKWKSSRGPKSGIVLRFGGYGEDVVVALVNSKAVKVRSSQIIEAMEGGDA